MEEEELQPVKHYTIDLTRIRGTGEFKCPKCGIKISPNDETENSYMVLQSVVKGDALEKIVLQCNKCGTQIHLIGFWLLNNIG